MSVPTKPLVLDVWGNANTTSADMVQPATAYLDAGWPLSSTPPARQYFNWVLNYTMNGVRYACRAGIADYDAAETYQSGDIVRYNGALWQCKTSGTINVTPSSTASQWQIPAVPTATAGDNSTQTASTAFVANGLAGKANISGTYANLSVGYATSAGSSTTAASANSVNWSGINGKPTTVSGYGITDGLTTAGGWTVPASCRFDGGLTVTTTAGGAPTQGGINFGNSGNYYLYFDSANFNFVTPSGACINGNQIATQSWVSGNYYTAAQSDSKYSTQSWVQQYFAPLSAFSNFFGSNGQTNYFRFPNGLIIQFGYATGGSSSTVGVCPVTFPVTFPNACLSAVCNGLRSTTGATPSNYVYNVSATGCDFLMDYSAALGAQGGYWMAFGH